MQSARPEGPSTVINTRKPSVSLFLKQLRNHGCRIYPRKSFISNTELISETKHLGVATDSRRMRKADIFCLQLIAKKILKQHSPPLHKFRKLILTNKAIPLQAPEGSGSQNFR
jgi:hypothetical protein